MAHARLHPCAPEPRPLDDLRRAIPALDAPTGWVEVEGPRPSAHPDLEAIVAELVRAGLRVRLVEVPSALSAARLATLQTAGLEILRLHLPTAASLEPAQIRAVAEALAPHPIRLELAATVTRDTLDGLPGLTRLATELSAALWLEGPGDGCRIPGVSRRRLAHTLHGVRTLSEDHGLELHHTGLAQPPQPPPPQPGPPLRLTAHLWQALFDQVPVQGRHGGCATADSPPQALQQAADKAGGATALAHQLAAWGCPVVDLPPDLGGPAGPRPVPPHWRELFGPPAAGPPPVQTPAPGRRVAVVDPPMSDKVTTLSTWPALARRLEALGADVRWVSAWGERDGMSLSTSGPARRADQAAAEARWRAALQSLDLSDRDLVVVPGLRWALDLWTHPTLPPHARLVIADDHLLDGIDAWKAHHLSPGRRSMDGDWWPSPRIHIHSCFPGYVHLYRLAGLPMDQIHWRPFPFDTRRFGTRPVPDDAPWFAGGNQNRDWATLARAAALRGDEAHPIELFTRRQPPGSLPGGLSWQGTLDLTAFHDRLARSRAVVIPVRYDRHAAAGLTVVAMALAAGRPVVASATPGTLDHLRHGEDSMLVPPGSPRALARALDHLDAHPAVRERLARGAARAAARLDVGTWARHLLEGAPPRPAGPPWSVW